MSVVTLTVTPEGVADCVEDLARSVSEAYGLYTHGSDNFIRLMQDYLHHPDPAYSAHTHCRAYSLDNNMIRLQTALSVLMDIANSVAEQDLGLTDRPGLVLRFLIDQAVRQARRQIDTLCDSAPKFALESSAPIFGSWPHAGRELIREHPLFDPENEEFF